MFEFRHLETFVWIARLGGFRTAAKRLNTTQPAVSARIAQLERQIGARLLDRKSRSVVLTAKGIEFLNYAERILAMRSEALRAVGNPTSFQGTLRFGVPETIVHTWLAVLVERINSAFPSVTLDIDVDSVPNLRAALLSENLDVAVLMEPIPDINLRCEPLCSFPLTWLASTALPLPQRRVTLVDIAGWPIITFRRGSPPYTHVRRLLDEHDLPAARLFSSSSIAAILRMTLDGIGVAVLPRTIAEQEALRHPLRLLAIQHELPPIDFCVCHKRNPDGFLAAAVADLAVEAAHNFILPATD